MTKRINGLYKNCDPIDQPEGYYRHALNITLDEAIGAVVNEKGTDVKHSLSSGYKVIGSILLPDDRVVLFSTNNTTSQIGILGESYTQLISGNLGFHTDYPIHGVSYKDNFNDTYVFWVDGKNNARFLNIDDPNINNIELFPSTNKTPTVSVQSVNPSGGQLREGAYYFAAAYVHKDRTVTNYYTIVGPVYIMDQSSGGVTTQSISLHLSNLDTDYESVQIAVIPSINGVFDEVEMLPEIPTSSTSITYTGGEAHRPGALEEVQIDKAYYEEPKCITIHDDNLILGNLKEREELDLQRYVNNIKVHSVVEDIENAFDGNSSSDNSYSNPIIASTKKGYKRGDVYAIYISFILKNGRETRAFHIPGRPPVSDEKDPVDFSGTKAYTPYIDVIDRVPEDTDISQFSVTYDGVSTDIAFQASMLEYEIAQHIANEVNSDPNQNITCELRAGTEFRFVEKREGSQHNGKFVALEGLSYLFSENVAVMNNGTGSSSTISGGKKFHFSSTPLSNGMAYWENSSEIYPNTSDWTIADSDGSQIGDLRGQPVRHHHFPGLSNYSIVNGDVMRVMAFRLSDINIPSEYQNEIVGYKVYTAERTEENKRKLDQAITIRSRVTGGTLVASDDNSGQSSPLILYTHPFNYLRNRTRVGGVSHVEILSELNRSSNSMTDDSPYERKFYDYSYSTPFTSNPARLVNAKAYVDTADGETGVNMQRYGFGLNINNYGGESKLVLDIIGMGDLSANSAYLIDICSHKLDLYNSFDLQNLVYTGYTHRNMSNTNSGTIYGGDIYITPYTFRASRRDGNTRHTALHRMIYESVDNINYRKAGENPWEIFFPLVSAVRASYVDYRADGEPVLGDGDLEIYENFLHYNNDFSKVNSLRFPLIYSKTRPTTVNHTTRLIRNTGGIRTFLQEDYLDVSKRRGEIVKLSTYNNLLIPHLERSILRTRGREELKTGDIRAFLGTGDIFSVAPEELIFTEDGFGGLSNISHAISTPFGYYFIDLQAKKAYKLDNDGIGDISEPLKPLFDNIPTNFRLGYNPVAETILFTNESWTYSYSPKRNAWMSEHSYKPERYFNTHSKFYSCVTNVIHEHEVGNRGRYYGTVYDTIFQFVDNRNPDVSKVAQSLRINSRVTD